MVPTGVSAGATRTSSTVDRGGEDESRERSVEGELVHLLNHHRGHARPVWGVAFTARECGHAAETRDPPDPGDVLKGCWYGPCDRMYAASVSQPWMDVCLC